MADVIGILSVALSTAQRLYDIVQTVKDAPNTVCTLGAEACKVKGLLQTMLSLPNGASSIVLQNTEQPLVKMLVQDAELLTFAVESFLEKATRLREDGTREVKALRWLLNSAKAEELSNRFKTLYSSLSAVYAMFTSCVLCCLQFVAEL